MKNIALLLGCLLLLTGFPQSAESAIGWITEINKGCKMWSPIDIDVNNKLSLSYAWLGDCKDGFASGKGIVKVLIDQRV